MKISPIGIFLTLAFFFSYFLANTIIAPLNQDIKPIIPISLGILWMLRFGSIIGIIANRKIGTICFTTAAIVLHLVLIIFYKTNYFVLAVDIILIILEFNKIKSIDKSSEKNIQ